MKLFIVEHPVLRNGQLGHSISSTLPHGLCNTYVCTIKYTQSSSHGGKESTDIEITKLQTMQTRMRKIRYRIRNMTQVKISTGMKVCSKVRPFLKPKIKLSQRTARKFLCVQHVMCTTDGQHVMCTTDGQHVMCTTDGQHVMCTTDGQHVMCTTGGQHVMCTTDGQHVMCTTGGEHVMCTTGGQHVMCTTGGQHVMCTTGGQHVMCTTDGQHVMCTTGGQHVMCTTDGQPKDSYWYTLSSCCPVFARALWRGNLSLSKSLTKRLKIQNPETGKKERSKDDCAKSFVFH